MPVISVTAADIAKNKLLDPGWFKMQVVKISPLTKSSKGDSVNMVYTFELEGTDGKQIDHNFNSKGWFGLPELHKAITGKDMDPGNIDTDEHLNKKCDGMVYQDNYGGRISNKIQSFLPYGKGDNSVPF